MIQIPRTTLRALRRDIRRALDVTSTKRAPAVTLRVVRDQLVIQAVTDQIAFEFRQPCPSTATTPEFCITVPNEVLRTCEGRTQETVTFERQTTRLSCNGLIAVSQRRSLSRLLRMLTCHRRRMHFILLIIVFCRPWQRRTGQPQKKNRGLP